MWWNFIGRSLDDVVEAREQWQTELGHAGEGRFGAVDYPGESLPAPALPQVRLRPRLGHHLAREVDQAGRDVGGVDLQPDGADPAGRAQGRGGPAGTGEPGWVVEYDAAPAELASGFPLAYEGNVALSVNLIGLNEPLRVGGLQGTGGVVNQVLPDKNHHGTSQFIIGLDQETPFSVTPLQEPPRLVVDILHEAAPPAPQPLGTPTREPKRQDSGAPHQQLITGVRLASHENFDRVVFDLVGSGSPGWITEFDAEPTHQNSAAPIDYEGSTALQVTLTGITPIAEDGSTQPLPDAAPVEGRVITEVVNGSIFEGHAQFVIGLEVNSPYSVSLLEDPQRVVVDVLHR